MYRVGDDGCASVHEGLNVSLLYTANAYGSIYTASTAAEACQMAATGFGVQVASFTDTQCNLSYSGSPWGVAGLSVSGSADQPPAATASSPSGSASGVSVTCSGACTVTHEISFPAWEFTALEGAQISGAVLLVWAGGYAIRMLTKLINDGGSSTKESD